MSRIIARYRLRGASLAAMVGLWLAPFAVSACHAGDKSAPIRFEGLGPHGRKVTTSSAEAQQYFNQGLAFLYAFNHDEAIRAFEHAAKLDPKCAMAYWGIAFANGPHVNNAAVDDAHSAAALAAIKKAQEHAQACTPAEQALIKAVASRYADPNPQDRKALDQAFADAMREVWKAHPADADIGSLFCESMLNLRPWAYWTEDQKPQPGTEEVKATLDQVMKESPNHPLALHLYIHLMEASSEPGAADEAANRLRDLAPGLGHLVHMPSHIDLRRGRWQEAVVANIKAIKTDDEYFRKVPKQGFYHIYMSHNRHMLAFAALMQGQSELATRSIREMLDRIPKEWIQGNAAMIDYMFTAPYEMHVRFGRWDAMLAEPAPLETMPISQTIWHHARAISHNAKGNMAEAKAEQAKFLEAKAKVKPDAKFGNNTAKDVLAIAELMLSGEILYREGKVDEAVDSLTKAIAIEDQLRYDEPPDWLIPVRHTLGATLIDAKRYADAEKVYLADLKRHPENGWSLYGLAASYKGQGKISEATDAKARFEKIWQHADFQLTSSCLCLPEK